MVNRWGFGDIAMYIVDLPRRAHHCSWPPMSLSGTVTGVRHELTQLLKDSTCRLSTKQCAASVMEERLLNKCTQVPPCSPCLRQTSCCGETGVNGKGPRRDGTSMVSELPKFPDISRFPSVDRVKDWEDEGRWGVESTGLGMS